MRTLTIAIGIMLAAGALAQPRPPTTGRNVVTPPLRPTEIDTVGCTFDGRELTGAGTVAVRLIEPPAQADATPADIIVAGPEASGSRVAVQLSPDEGCAPSGCRAGNSYQVCLRVEAGTDRPICCFRADVRDEVMR